MRTVKIQGGLGNQVFGLAFAHSITTLTGESAALDLTAYRADQYGRGFVFARLARRLGFSTIGPRQFLASRGVDVLARALPLPGFFRETRPPNSVAALQALTARRAYFSGYWQDESYIAAPDAFRRAVRADLVARAEVVANHDIVIHYRTYKEERRPARRAVPGPAYFRGCVAALKNRGVAVRNVALISDDPPLAFDQIGEIGAVVTPLIGGSPWSDMATLLSARHLILTNSSFSWWGGYCGDAQTVCYPEASGLFHYPRPAARFAVIKTAALAPP